ncbi:hypothetical protein ACHAXT_004572 [Thalassiosira profunda]
MSGVPGTLCLIHPAFFSPSNSNILSGTPPFGTSTGVAASIPFFFRYASSYTFLFTQLSAKSLTARHRCGSCNPQSSPSSTLLQKGAGTSLRTNATHSGHTLSATRLLPLQRGILDTSSYELAFMELILLYPRQPHHAPNDASKTNAAVFCIHRVPAFSAISSASRSFLALSGLIRTARYRGKKRTETNATPDNAMPAKKADRSLAITRPMMSLSAAYRFRTTSRSSPLSLCPSREMRIAH